jgi:hypothetical protein
MRFRDPFESGLGREPRLQGVVVCQSPGTSLLCLGSGIIEPDVMALEIAGTRHTYGHPNGVVISSYGMAKENDLAQNHGR